MAMVPFIVTTIATKRAARMFTLMPVKTWPSIVPTPSFLYNGEKTDHPLCAKTRKTYLVRRKLRLPYSLRTNTLIRTMINTMTMTMIMTITTTMTTTMTMAMTMLTTTTNTITPTSFRG